MIQRNRGDAEIEEMFFGRSVSAVQRPVQRASNR